jgi:TAT (twin-arginine translocation) pathway signal sequence
MRVSRRTLLKSVGVAGAATALPAQTFARNPALAIYDSRLPEGAAFGASATAMGLPTVDVAGGDRAILKVARHGLSASDTVIGLTGWSEWVIVRGLLEERGKRLSQEKRIAHSGKRNATPFEWIMS